MPEIFKSAFISAIPKKQKSRLCLENERGIFLVSKLRAMLEKLIYRSIISLIEEKLSPSNIGARQNKSPRDHLYVLYAVMHETLKEMHDHPIDLVFNDGTQCFDSLWV